MEYVKLGNSPLTVSRLCVGCMSFGDPASRMHAWTLDPAESEEIVKHALSLGINFFDTANTYSAGTSEEYLGRAIRSNVPRDQVILASKVYFNEGHLSREAILREIDGTLQRLGTDYLDLYIIHRFDADTPVEETMEALDSLVRRFCPSGCAWCLRPIPNGRAAPPPTGCTGCGPRSAACKWGSAPAHPRGRAGCSGFAWKQMASSRCPALQAAC